MRNRAKIGWMAAWFAVAGSAAAYAGPSKPPAKPLSEREKIAAIAASQERARIALEKTAVATAAKDAADHKLALKNAAIETKDPTIWKSPLDTFRINANRVPQGYIAGTKTSYTLKGGLSIPTCPQSAAEWKTWQASVSKFLLTQIEQLKQSELKEFFRRLDECAADPDIRKQTPNVAACVSDFKQFVGNVANGAPKRADFNAPNNRKDTELPTELTANGNELLTLFRSAKTYSPALNEEISSTATPTSRPLTALERVAEINKRLAADPKTKDRQWVVSRYRIQNIGGLKGFFVVGVFVPGDPAQGIPEKWIRIATQTPPEFTAKYPALAARDDSGARGDADETVCMFTTKSDPDFGKPDHPFPNVTAIGDSNFGYRHHAQVKPRYGDPTDQPENCQNCHQNAGVLFTDPDPVYFENAQGKPFVDQAGFIAKSDRLTEKIATYPPANFGKMLYPPGKGPIYGDASRPATSAVLKSCAEDEWAKDKSITVAERIRMRGKLSEAMSCTTCHNDQKRGIVRLNYRNQEILDRLITGKREPDDPTSQNTHVVMPPYGIFDGDYPPAPGQKPSRDQILEQKLRAVMPACLQQQYVNNFAQPGATGFDPKELRLEFQPLVYLSQTNCGAVVTVAEPPSAPSVKGTGTSSDGRK